MLLIKWFYGKRDERKTSRKGLPLLYSLVSWAGVVARASPTTMSNLMQFIILFSLSP